MVRVVDQASRRSPEVVPTLFVYDLSVGASGGNRSVQDKIASFTNAACKAIEADGMEVSRTKSVCTASDTKLGRNIADELADFGI